METTLEAQQALLLICDAVAQQRHTKRTTTTLSTPWGPCPAEQPLWLTRGALLWSTGAVCFSQQTCLERRRPARLASQRALRHQPAGRWGPSAGAEMHLKPNRGGSADSRRCPLAVCKAQQHLTGQTLPACLAVKVRPCSSNCAMSTCAEAVKHGTNWVSISRYAKRCSAGRATRLGSHGGGACYLRNGHIGCVLQLKWQRTGPARHLVEAQLLSSSGTMAEWTAAATPTTPGAPLSKWRLASLSSTASGWMVPQAETN